MRDSVRASVGTQHLEYHAFEWYGDVSDYYWLAFYDYFERIGIPFDAGLKYHEYKRLVTAANVFMWVGFENYAFVCKSPKYIQLGQTILFRDGYCLDIPSKKCSIVPLPETRKEDNGSALESCVKVNQFEVLL